MAPQVIRLTRKKERGQVLVLFIALISVFFVAAAMTIDYGLWLSDRRGIARSSDMAALAGAQDLPANPSISGPFTSVGACDAPAQIDPDGLGLDPCVAAFTWAERNGYGPSSGAEVAVNFFCGNTLSATIVNNINAHTTADHHVCYNENQGDPALVLSPCPTAGSTEEGCDAINVTITKDAVTLLTAFGGGVNFEVGFGSWGNVTFKLIPTDSVVVMDRSGSMSEAVPNPCPSACTKMGQAKIAANNFVDFLVNGSPVTKVGFAPFSDCYNPPHTGGVNTCVPAPAPGNILTPFNCDVPGASQIACLFPTANRAHSLINAVAPNGATNICLGVLEGRKVLRGPGDQHTAANPDAERFLVLLSDGENVYQASSNAGGALDPLCRPTASTVDGGSQSCNQNRSTQNAELDLKTLQLATSMQAQNLDNDVEFFTIQLYDGACVPSNSVPTPAECDQIGSTSLTTGVAGTRLLKCIASSTPGTNDHYFPTSNAQELGNIFQIIALEIAGRGLTAGPP